MAVEREMEVLNVRLPREMYEGARRRAEAEDRTISQLVRRAIRQYLAKPSDDTMVFPFPFVPHGTGQDDAPAE